MRDEVRVVDHSIITQYRQVRTQHAITKPSMMQRGATRLATVACREGGTSGAAADRAMQRGASETADANGRATERGIELATIPHTH